MPSVPYLHAVLPFLPTTPPPILPGIASPADHYKSPPPDVAAAARHGPVRSAKVVPRIAVCWLDSGLPPTPGFFRFAPGFLQLYGGHFPAKKCPAAVAPPSQESRTAVFGYRG